MKKRFILTPISAIIGLCFNFAVCPWAFAHCDTLDGPVIMDARLALEKSDVTPVLKWVMADKENEIREAFRKTLVVRSKGAEAQELADMYFFETLVRIHREGEGAPYTGLKPAGEIEPGIAAADKAIETGSVDELLRNLNAALGAGVREHFAEVMETKKHADHNVEAGREYVAAYVTFIHYVERLQSDITRAPSHEHGETARPH
ncbi:MAG TPA: DUF6448 family protein [bacterium]|jgi:hypothetical protein